MVKEKSFFAKKAGFCYGINLVYNTDMETEKETIPEKKEENEKKEGLIITLIAIFVLGIIFGGAYWVWQKIKPSRGDKKVSIQNLVEEMPKVGEKNQGNPGNQGDQGNQKEEPPVEEKTVNLADIDVKVLNGGAAAGTAAKVKTNLIASGYAKAESGNAGASGYKAVTIYYKSDFADQIQGIKDILKTAYGTIETKEGMNEKEITGDIVIILGK